MNTIEKNTRLTPEPTSSGAAQHQWAGHMADDVANTYGPEPMATLTATPDALVLSGTRGTYRVPRNAVKEIGRGALYPWFFCALRIHHNVPGFPQNLQFRPIGLKPREVIEQLVGLGYPHA